MEKTITRTRIDGVLLAGLIATMALAGPAVEFAHLYTFGSKPGIHPPRALNGRLPRAALGNGDNPYGLLAPAGVTTDIRHRVWITDGGTASIHIFDRASGDYREIRRAGDFALRKPCGIAADEQGRIYVTDAALGGVVVFTPSGDFDRWMIAPGSQILQAPSAIAIADDGRTVFVADPPRDVVLAFNREGEIDATIRLSPETADPAGLLVVANRLYVLGNRQHRVAVFTHSGVARGEARWDGIPLPAALAYDRVRGWFLLADPRRMVVQVFDPDGRGFSAFGQVGEAIDQMQHVDSMYVDPRGLIYVVDTLHGKVLVFADARHP